MVRRLAHLLVAVVLALMGGLSRPADDAVRGSAGPERRARMMVRSATPSLAAIARLKDAGPRRLPALHAAVAHRAAALPIAPGVLSLPDESAPTRLALPALPSRAPPPA